MPSKKKTGRCRRSGSVLGAETHPQGQFAEQLCLTTPTLVDIYYNGAIALIQPGAAVDSVLPAGQAFITVYNSQLQIEHVIYSCVGITNHFHSRLYD